ncbi:hypothetical protein HPB51_013609 [Rhipicephalus microplus]|uniref:DDE Tnp4 domain-containing protein n=1 Tax=Rhipicephalus microplus TaxID=6941 RepID=A0A9J6EH25_RHIMP|nr:hypothetical protein HPB51_013609 [Rhipicephalus microplus]
MVLTKRRKRLLLLKKKVLLAQMMLEEKRQWRWWLRPSWRTRHAESEFFTTEPKTETWLHIAEGFSRTWQFPNCIGAVDGKHIQIKCPPNSGTMYFNYKGTYSIVLLAVVDSDYKFVIVDVGAYGKQSDGGVLEQSKFGCRLENGKLHIPRDLELPNTSYSAPCVFVGDEAFPLRTDFLRPYPGRGLEGEKRIFNYRLSRAR